MRHSWEGVGPDAETTAAASALTSVVLERDLARLRDWLAREASADPAWRRAAFLTESLLYLTREELAALGRVDHRAGAGVQRPHRPEPAGPRERHPVQVAPGRVPAAADHDRELIPCARCLQNRDARLLLIGQSLSLFGDRSMYLVLGIWVKTLTGSNAQAGLVFFVLAAPGLLAPAFGLAVDRMRKRPLMIATDIVIGLVLLTLLFVHGRGDVWIIYAVTLVYGASGYLFSSAQSALLTRMLPPERLGDANAALQTVSEGSRLIAPLIGAGLFAAVGGAAVAILDAATFAASALCLLGVRLREERPVAPEHHILVQVAAGVRHIARTAGLRRIVLVTGLALLVVGFIETAIFAVLQHGLHRPPSFLGVLSVAQGVGAIAGGVTASAALRRFGDGRTLGVGILLFAAGDALFLIPSLVPVLAGFASPGPGSRGRSWPSARRSSCAPRPTCRAASTPPPT